MNIMKSQILTSLLAILLSITTVRAQSIEGTPYCLPMNGAQFTIKVEKTQYTPGRFCQYSMRYLKQNVELEPSTTYRIIGIDIDVTARPDTSRHFKLIVDKKHSINQVTCSPDGQLLAINTDAAPIKATIRQFVPAQKPDTPNPADFMTEDILNATSTTKMAELTAKEIYDIRDSRNQLSKGEADFMPKDGTQLKLMLANLNRQETALRQLFEGVVTKDTTWTTVNYMPMKEGNNVLFRFSTRRGLVDHDDLGGEPYYITVTNLYTAPAPAPVPAGQKEDKADIGLRISKPSRIKLTLQHNTDIVATFEMNAAQFGTVESLSGDLFGKKQSTALLLDPMTGSIKEIRQITPQVPK